MIDFIFEATSIDSGKLCVNNFLPIALTGGSNFMANGKPTQRTTAASYPKPLPLCLLQPLSAGKMAHYEKNCSFHLFLNFNMNATVPVLKN